MPPAVQDPRIISSSPRATTHKHTRTHTYTCTNAPTHIDAHEHTYVGACAYAQVGEGKKKSGLAGVRGSETAHDCSELMELAVRAAARHVVNQARAGRPWRHAPADSADAHAFGDWPGRDTPLSHILIHTNGLAQGVVCSRIASLPQVRLLPVFIPSAGPLSFSLLSLALSFSLLPAPSSSSASLSIPSTPSTPSILVALSWLLGQAHGGLASHGIACEAELN